MMGNSPTVFMILFLLTCLLLSPAPLLAGPTGVYDLIIVGATPGGIMAAVAATRASKSTAKILILERTSYIGGLPANGLGATDITTRLATGGLFLEFVGRVKQLYIDIYGANSRQVADCQGGYHFEPKIGEAVMKDFLAEISGSVHVKLRRQLDVDVKNVNVDSSGYVKRVGVLNRDSGEKEWYQGKYFIDATYEGDLIAASRIPFFSGRESASKYDEIGAGVVYKYWHGKEAEGTTHKGDNRIQAYNYRLSLTNDPNNVYKIPKPKNYNRTEYVSLIDDIITGCHTGYQAEGRCPKSAGDPDVQPNFPGMPVGIHRLSSIAQVPNRKWDGNNQHLAFISTDLPEENQAYPTASWAWRDRFAERLRSYTLGFFYFAQNDPEVPQWFRKQVATWGLSRDEYVDNRYFPRQVYVREGRRMHGEYIFTSRDATPVASGKRPPVHSDSITSSHYPLDSHGVKKREYGRAHLDGFVSYPTKPYTVPYGVIVPTKKAGIRNILAPVPVSGSHIGFSTLRMEPCWMALGQAAGTAVALLLQEGGKTAVHDLHVPTLQNSLLEEGAVLVYIPGWQKLSQKERIKKQKDVLGRTG